MNRWEMEKKIAIAALKDPAFKKKLLAHPKEALKELFKDHVYLEKLNVKVEEEKKNEWIIPIPFVEPPNQALSEEDLQRLAAGVGFTGMPMGMT